ncbi:DNA-processing protein DprA [Morganella psychrotolerans]|uniref:DNA-processing protein DprA n=1 Tax=Morganella psychrotolerans TaxID=368603 RepID=UPI0039B06346
MNEREIWLRLACIRRLSTHHAVSVAKTLTEICSQKKAQILRQLHHCGLTLAQCQQFMNVNSSRLKTALLWADLPGHSILPLSSPHYPFLLKQIYSPPTVLFVAGQCAELSAPQVSLVGSRATTHYGEKWAESFTRHLVQHNLVITSGLAAGIDGCCHRAALAAGGKTIAVLGSGLSHIYPARHRQLAEIITEKGALVSEYFPDVPPLAKNFPRRNRIISGLSRLLIVIEAGRRSGSLITAQCALEQGRDVFTLPAVLGHPAYEGNHWLLQQGAYIATAPSDITDHLALGMQWLSLPEIQEVKEIKEEEMIADQEELPFAHVLINVDDEPTPADVIAQRCELPVTEVTTQLLQLELSGKIAVVSGGYIRLHK